MSELIIEKMLQSGTIVVFDGFHCLKLYHQGADHKKHAIKPLRDFMKKKDLNEVYVWADQENKNLANAFTKEFCTAAYGYHPEHTCYAANPVHFLDSLRKELGVTNDNIIFIGNDSETLTRIEIDGDYLAYPISVFLTMDNVITVLDADSIVPELVSLKRTGLDPYWLVTSFLTHTNLENVYVRATIEEIVQMFKALACEPEHVDAEKLHFIASHRSPLEFLDYLKDTLDVPAENIVYVPANTCISFADQAAHHKMENDTDYMFVFHAEDL